jgi:hypothetical protein
VPIAAQHARANHPRLSSRKRVALSGTHTRGVCRMDRCIWVPVFHCVETGMKRLGDLGLS